MVNPGVANDYPAGRAFASITGLTIGLFCLGVVLSPYLLSAPDTRMPQDLSDAAFVEVRTLDGDVVMSGELRNRVDRLGNIEKDAALLGPNDQQVIGEIEIEIPRAGVSNPRQELEVDVISLKPRTSYQVVVNDLPVARFTTDDRGSVDVEFD